MLRSVSSRVGALGVALLLVGGGLVAGSVGAAAAVDISLDFTAAAPLTYDHSTGGGAYNNRTVGRAKDIVESLEGSDFRCGDIVILTFSHIGIAASGVNEGGHFDTIEGNTNDDGSREGYKVCHKTGPHGRRPSQIRCRIRLTV